MEMAKWDALPPREENRVAIEVMTENRMDFLGQMHTGDDSGEEDSEDSSEED